MYLSTSTTKAELETLPSLDLFKTADFCKEQLKAEGLVESFYIKWTDLRERCLTVLAERNRC